MKRILAGVMVLCSLFLASCTAFTKRSAIPPQNGGVETTDFIRRSYDVDAYFREHYVEERTLPVLDMDLQNPFVYDGTTLILEDSIDNSLELMIYEYYHSLTKGAFQTAKEMTTDDSLLASTEAYEKNFYDGIFYSRIVLDEIDLCDRDDLHDISGENKQSMVELLSDFGMEVFAIVKAEVSVSLNDKGLRLTPEVRDFEMERYFLFGKKDGVYKIVDVYREGFLND